MAYDEALAARVRERLADAGGITEKRMFGGLAFLVDGKMAVAATSDGLMVRVDREQTDALAAREGAGPMVMRGRPIEGWVLVDAAALSADDALSEWVERGVTFARSLPDKG